MASLIIEIQRGSAWNKLTTVRIAASGPSDEQAARRRAKQDAERQLRSWRGYFTSDRLRIREVA
ncbi:hypothetical protein [Chelativorans sp.]|uniref:hypothetical protein n=1 Tax=Chelativorans sp. TaxID=2203393 RepID=UPI002811F9AF|nr:hypothetical protein [Chelativorans sp.]